MLRIKSDGDFKDSINALEELVNNDIFSDFDKFGRMGVDALAQATPVDTGQTAGSWGYRIIEDENRPGIEWTNSNTIANGTPVVILLQYGHGTGTGGYVTGYDFINPAIRPIFDQIELDVWKKVIS